jgi:hypothetical protein
MWIAQKAPVRPIPALQCTTIGLGNCLCTPPPIPLPLLPPPLLPLPPLPPA